jgi:ABC-type transport system involved in cytochrome c biogenesis permease component
VTTVNSRLRALRVYLAVAVVPAALAFVVMDVRPAALLAVMWVLLIGTAGLAATTQRPESPRTWGDKGRLHG